MRLLGGVVQARQARFTTPTGAADLLIVRHAETEALAEGERFPLLDGQGNPGLHERGIRQAELLAERLAVENVSAIYVTPLRRTALTAVPLVARLGITPRVERVLREVHLGDLDGTPFLRVSGDRDPLVARMYREERWDVIPNAEGAEEFRSRITRGVTGIAARHAGETVVLVVHGGVIAEILAIAARAGRGFAFLGADNCSISQLIVDGDRWTVRRYNDTAHLHAGFSTSAQGLT